MFESNYPDALTRKSSVPTSVHSSHNSKTSVQARTQRRRNSHAVVQHAESCDRRKVRSFPTDEFLCIPLSNCVCVCVCPFSALSCAPCLDIPPDWCRPRSPRSSLPRESTISVRRRCDLPNCSNNAQGDAVMVESNFVELFVNCCLSSCKLLTKGRGWIRLNLNKRYLVH